jgi:predicted RNase H-like HicB family nuclease
MSTEFAVRIEFRRGDGRCYISSPDLPGLHLAGDDLDALRNQLDTIIKDLVWHNYNRVIDKLRWIPNLDEIVEKYKAAERTIDTDHTEVCVMQLEAA